MRMPVQSVAVLIMICSSSACTLLSPTRGVPETAPAATTAQWTFTVVRHAERADDGTDDPPLTDAGANRADRLADLLAGQRGVAVYATPYRRTQSTADPTASAWGVAVTTYDPTQQASELTSGIRSTHPRGAILIVGHSDTVPLIVGELCRCSVDPIQETDFSNLFRVELAADGDVLKAEQTADY